MLRTRLCISTLVSVPARRSMIATSSCFLTPFFFDMCSDAPKAEAGKVVVWKLIRLFFPLYRMLLFRFFLSPSALVLLQASPDILCLFMYTSYSYWFSIPRYLFVVL